MTKAKTRIAQIYHLGAPGSLARGPKESLPPDAQPSEPAPTPALWSLAQILAWIISRAETNVLTPEAKIEWAKKELVKELDKELSKMRARSVEIDRAVLLEGQTLPSLRDNDSVFRISGFRSGALAHLLRIGYLTQEDVRWDDIDGDPEGVKRLWPARTAAEALEVESEAPGKQPATACAAARAAESHSRVAACCRSFRPESRPAFGGATGWRPPGRGV